MNELQAVLTVLRAIETFGRFSTKLRAAIEEGRNPSDEDWDELDDAITDARNRFIAASIMPPVDE